MSIDVSGSSWSQRAKLTEDHSYAIDQFGGSVAVSGDGTSTLVGATDAEGGGAAYVFDRADGYWNEPTRLTANDAEDGDSFGGSVAMSNDGTSALIGARLDDESTGSAYIFGDSGGWSQQAKLIADDGDEYTDFGSSVAVSSDGTTALIGAREDDNPNDRRSLGVRIQYLKAILAGFATMHENTAR